MNIRRGVRFAWRIALAYLRFSVTIVLAGVAILSVISIVMILMRDGLSGGLVQSFRIMVQIISFTALGISAMFGVGLLWNVIGVGVGMSLTSGELDLGELRTAVPKRLFLYNLLGLPACIIVLGLLSPFPNYAVICVGALSVLISYASADIARTAWGDVANWYEFRGRSVKQKMKNTTKLKHDAVASENDAALLPMVERDLPEQSQKH